MSAILKTTIPHKVEIPLSGENIAELFWALDDNEQAKFFNELSRKERFVFQLAAVGKSTKLNDGGRYVMAQIGEYATP